MDLLHANAQKLQVPSCCELGISDFARFPGSLIAIIKKNKKFPLEKYEERQFLTFVCHVFRQLFT